MENGHLTEEEKRWVAQHMDLAGVPVEPKLKGPDRLLAWADRRERKLLEKRARLLEERTRQNQ